MRLIILGVCLFAGAGQCAEIKTLVSGAFRGPYQALTPAYEAASGNRVVSAGDYAPSVGTSPDSIPNRLKRGQAVDVVILSGSSLGELIKQGLVRSDSRVDLVRSSIGVAVRKGAPKPDISSVEALKRALLNAKSIAYSSSVSGVYVSTELFQHLGIAGQVMGKSRRIEAMVGPTIASGEFDLGIQQISELVAVEGIDIIGPLPAEVQRVTVFSAGIPTASKVPEAAASFIKFLASQAAVPIIKKSGLDPISSTGPY